MSLQFIYGKSGTGKTTYCFNEIKNLIDNNEKVYIITPEQFSFTAEKNLMEVSKKDAVMSAEVITFKRLAYRILSEIGNCNSREITTCGKAMLIANILEKQKENLNFLGRNDKNIDVISRLITELKKNNISEEILNDRKENIEEKYLKLKIEDINLIFNEFNKSIKDKYLDDDDTLTIVKDKISKSKMFYNSHIYIDEFSGFTKQEYGIIEELLKISKQINVTVCTDSLEQSNNIDSDIFNQNKKMIYKLKDIANNNNIKILESIELKKIWRYKNEELLYLEENLYNLKQVLYNKKINNIRLFLANNNYSEVEYVANNIIELVRDMGYMYRDISIITKNIEDYSSLIKSIFNKYEIPVYIDEKKDLNQNILVKYLISILDVFSKSWSQESIFNYIKTGFASELDLNEIYLIENYCKKCGIKGYKKFTSEWSICVDINDNLEELNNIRLKIIMPLVKFKEDIGKNKTVGDITKALYNFLIENNIPEKLLDKIEKLNSNGNIELANIYEASWNTVIDILDELVLVLGEEKISFEKYINLLKVGLNNSSLGKIPATLDQVDIGNVDRTRSSKKKVIFIIGLNDGKFPSVNKSEGFIDDNERIYLKEIGIELAKTTLEQMYDENFNIYKAFGIAEEKLFLSYPASDNDGKGLRKSVLINKIKRIFPNLEEESDIVQTKTYISSKEVTFDNLLLNMRKYLNGEDIDNIWFEIYKIYSEDEEYKTKLEKSIQGFIYNNIAENISKENLEKLYGDKLVTSISKLESYRRCPFSYYLRYGLKLSDKTELKLERLDTGTFMHDVINEFFEHINKENLNIKEIDEETIEKIVEQIIEDKLQLKQNYIFNIVPKYIVLANRLKKVIIQAIKYIVKSLKYSDFKVLGTEVEFGAGKEFEPIKIELENGKKVEIIGKIDRIDIAENNDKKYIRIIDYKSSVKKVDLNEVVAGVQIQLLTYLDAVSKSENAESAATLYFNLIEPVIKKNSKYLTEEKIEEEIRKNFKMDGLILGNVEVVKMMDNRLVSGDSDIISAGINKDGDIKNKSNILKQDEFRRLQNKVEKVIKEILKEIMSGNISPKPTYLMKNKTSTCKYCNYRAICGFDSKMCNNTYNFIPNLKKEEIINNLDV